MECQSTRSGLAIMAYQLVLLTIGGIGGVGCSSSDVDMTVRQPEGQRSDIDQKAASKGVLSIPADAKFNYSTFRSGQEGASATGTAQAIGNNGARCRAMVSGVGTAWGSFQLGYSFDNVTDERLSAVVKVKIAIHDSVDYKHDANAPCDPPEVSGTIFFFIKDTNGIVSVKESLLSSNRDKGATASTDQKHLILNATFEPRRGYYLVITGRTDVETTDSQSAEALLEVTDVSMEIQWQKKMPETNQQ